MFEMHSLGKMLVVFGGVLVVVGILFMLGGKIPWLGRLPGDILIQKKNLTLYFPIATSILISIVLSLVVYFVGRR